MPKGHAQNPGYRPGNNWVTCDRCGFERRASDIKTEWNGLEVCSDTCFETRHPQDFLRAKEESITPNRVGTKSSESNVVSVEWSPTNLVYSGKSLVVSSEITSARSGCISNDGTKVYCIGTSDDTIYQYTLTTAWDISTAAYSSKSLDCSSQGADATGMHFKRDGTQVFVAFFTSGRIYAYDLSVAWDVSTGTYNSNFKDTATTPASPSGVSLSSDGTRLLVSQAGGDDKIYQWTLSTAWDLTTASYDTITQTVASLRGIDFSDDDDTVWVIAQLTDSPLYRYSLDTEKTIASWSLTGTGYATEIPSGTGTTDIFLSSYNNLTVYIVNRTSDTIYQYYLTDSSIPTGTFTGSGL